MDAWNSRFAEQSALLSSLMPVASTLAGAAWPDRHLLQGLLTRANVRTASDLPLQLVPPAAGGGSYEWSLYERGEMQFRERNWHDLFNVLTWLQFPRAKAALNARHHAELARVRDAGGRGPVRDALTLFDEDGVIVIAVKPELLRMIRDFQWKALFWEHRAAVLAAMTFLPFGHALCEKALTPYHGMTARGLLLETGPGFFSLPPAAQLREIDERVAQRLSSGAAFRCPQDLSPVPVLGVPGWYPDNARAAYYDDRNYFRPGRVRRAKPANTQLPVAGAAGDT